MASHPKINQGDVDALKPDDPRVEHKYIDVGDGITYHYLLANPESTPVATVVLIHGWYVYDACTLKYERARDYCC